MAETLGSLIDKLSIKNLRLWHLDEMIDGLPKKDAQRPVLEAKRRLVLRQQQELLAEIDGFLVLAMQGKVRIRDEKIKLYVNRGAESSKGVLKLGEAVSELALRNIRLWHLEDEVRRPGLSDAQVVKVKRAIDSANQERNDLMDKVDEILSGNVKVKKKKTSR
jgi:hypothetical protein